MRGLRLVALATVLASGCGGSGDGGADAAAIVDGAGLADAPAGGADAPVAATAELEPNNGTTADDVNVVTLPGSITGTIDPANDVDVFSVTVPAGSRWRFRLEEAGGGTLAPHLAVVNHADDAPTSVALEAAGNPVELEQVILAGGRHNLIVRDARNVGGSPAGIGNPTLGYRLIATPLDRTPVVAAVPSTATGALDTPFAVALYQFTLATETDVRIDVRAARLDTPSDLDTRASLVRLSDGAYLITNDDLPGSLDSRVEGLLPAGDYLLIVDNVEPTATTRNFEIDFALR